MSSEFTRWYLWTEAQNPQKFRVATFYAKNFPHEAREIVSHDKPKSAFLPLTTLPNNGIGKWLNCNWDPEIDETKMNIGICSFVQFVQLVLVQVFRLVNLFYTGDFCIITVQIIITLLI